MSNKPNIPPNTPKEHIRRVAFLYAPQQKAKCAEFLQFLHGVALKVSKKPLFIDEVAVEEFTGTEDPKATLARLKAAGAVGVVAILAGIPEPKVSQLDEAFAEAEMFLRNVAPETVQKRSTAVDLVVDLMLLSAG